MSHRVEGRVAIVTGAASGAGKEDALGAALRVDTAQTIMGLA